MSSTLPTRMINILDLGPEAVVRELTDRLDSWGEKPYRVKQILRNIYQRREPDFRLMTDLPRQLRLRLEQTYHTHPLTAVRRSVSADGTVKVLWHLEDAAHVESVTIPMEKGRVTFCLSTQTGCSLGCKFCATGRIGPGRNLSVSEIACQALCLLAEQEHGGVPEGGSSGASAPNIVFMGMGEPLLNYENLKTALEILNHNDLMQVGARRITVSTVGIPEGLVRFSRDFPQMKLAVSLHAADDGLRARLMPIAGKYPLKSLLAACQEAYRITGKRITFEYLVIPGVNDREEDLEGLLRISAQLPCKINLIGFNPVAGVPFRAPGADELVRFQKALVSRSRRAVTLRQSHGGDIAAACGQLAADMLPSRRKKSRGL